MNRVINACDKSVVVETPSVVAVAANTDTNVLASLQNSGREYAGRYVQNIGSNPCFYALSQNCDGAANIHGQLGAGQQLDCSNHCLSVNVFSPIITITHIRLSSPKRTLK